MVIVTALVVAGRRRAARAPRGGAVGPPCAAGPSGLRLDLRRPGADLLALVGLAGLDLRRCWRRSNSPAAKPALTLEVTGHQWWWEVRYLGATPGEGFATANEIHIPVGQPVLVELIGADVIHSFWVPALAGKTDTIPGRTNLTWLQADQAGRLPRPVHGILRRCSTPTWRSS